MLIDLGGLRQNKEAKARFHKAIRVMTKGFLTKNSKIYSKISFNSKRTCPSRKIEWVRF
jgi:hypothetical protein